MIGIKFITKIFAGQLPVCDYKSHKTRFSLAVQECLSTIPENNEIKCQKYASEFKCDEQRDSCTICKRVFLSYDMICNMLPG